MQDRNYQNRGNLLHRTAGPYIGVISSPYERESRAAATPEQRTLFKAQAQPRHAFIDFIRSPRPHGRVVSAALQGRVPSRSSN
jgi:hypothetical protein